MFRAGIEAAWKLDEWLKHRIGRPYTILLTVALVAGMSANIRAAVVEVENGRNLIVVTVTIAVYAVLLINQLAQLHEYRQASRARREERRAAKTKG